MPLGDAAWIRDEGNAAGSSWPAALLSELPTEHETTPPLHSLVGGHRVNSSTVTAAGSGAQALRHEMNNSRSDNDQDQQGRENDPKLVHVALTGPDPPRLLASPLELSGTG
jgi:hypothetical protein